MSRKDEDAEEKQYSNWCDLPPLFMSSLLYHLSSKTRCAFRATCRSWNDATLLLPVPVGSPSSPYHSSPALICNKSIRAGRKTTSYECYFPMTGEYLRLSTGDKRFRHAVVHCSNFGWLLLSSSEHRRRGDRFFLFFNPFTKHIIHHGIDSSNDRPFSALCFTSPPTNSSDRQELSGMSFADITVTRDGRRNSLDLLISTGNKTTCISRLRFPAVLRNHHLSGQNCLIFHRSLYYCLVGAGVVGVFGHDTYTFHDTKLFECGTKLRHSYLIEVDGKLLGIFDYQGISVLWLDTGKWEWDPVGDEDLRDKILYVSYKGSFVQCDDTTKGVGNKIYFPTIIDGGGVYYSLDTKKFHTLSRELDEIMYYGYSLTWIVPTSS